jgi:hypothetical protein
MTTKISGWQKALVISILSIIPSFSFANTQTTSASVETIYETTDPFGGYFGIYGFDVSKTQSVATRFTPAKDVSLEQIKLWLMNNDFSGDQRGTVVVSLRSDEPVEDGKSIPSSNIIEQWVVKTSATGWDPQQETVTSLINPVLKAGVNYWVVATSDDVSGHNAVWNVASASWGFVTNTQPFTGEWAPISEQIGAATAITITGQAVAK